MNEASTTETTNRTVRLWMLAGSVVIVTTLVVSLFVQSFPTNEGFDVFFSRIALLVAIIGGIAGVLKLAYVITQKVCLDVVAHSLILTATITSLIMASVKIEHIDTGAGQGSSAVTQDSGQDQ